MQGRVPIPVEEMGEGGLRHKKAIRHWRSVTDSRMRTLLIMHITCLACSRLLLRPRATLLLHDRRKQPYAGESDRVCVGKR